jgi:hypothetical protein
VHRGIAGPRLLGRERHAQHAWQSNQSGHSDVGSAV